MSFTRRAFLATTAAAVGAGGPERVFGQELSAGQALEARLNQFQLIREPGAWDKTQNHVVIPTVGQRGEVYSVFMSTGSFVYGETDFKPQDGLAYLVLTQGQGTFAASHLEPNNYYAQQLNGARVNKTNFLDNVKKALYAYNNDRVQIVLIDLPQGSHTVLEANKTNIPESLELNSIPQALTYVGADAPNFGLPGQRSVEASGKMAPFADIEVAKSGPAHFWISSEQNNLVRGRSIAPGETSTVLPTADNNNVFYMSVGHVKLEEADLPYADGNPFLVLVKGSQAVTAENLAGGYVQEVKAPLASKRWFSDQVRFALYNQNAEKAYVALYDADSKEMLLYVADKSVVAANSGEEILDMLTPVEVPTNGQKVEEVKPLTGIPTDAQSVIKSNSERPKRLPTVVTTDSLTVDLAPGKVYFLSGGHADIPFFGANLTQKEGRTHLVVMHSEYPIRVDVKNLSPRNATLNVIDGDSVNADWLLEQVQHPQAPGQTDVTVLNVGQRNVTARWEINKSSVNGDNPYGVWNSPVDVPQAKLEARPTMDGLPTELNRVLSVDGGYPKDKPMTLTEKETTLNLQPGMVRVVISDSHVVTGRDQQTNNSEYRPGQIYLTILRADEAREVKLTGYSANNTLLAEVPADKANPGYIRDLLKVMTDRGQAPVVSMFQTGRENFVASFDGRTWVRVK